MYIKSEKNSTYVDATVTLLTDHEWRWFFSKYIISVPLLNPRTLRLFNSTCFTRYFHEMRANVPDNNCLRRTLPNNNAVPPHHTAPQGWRGSIARRRMWNKAYVITPGSRAFLPQLAQPLTLPTTNRCPEARLLSLSFRVTNSLARFSSSTPSLTSRRHVSHPLRMCFFIFSPREARNPSVFIFRSICTSLSPSLIIPDCGTLGERAADSSIAADFCRAL